MCVYKPRYRNLKRTKIMVIYQALLYFPPFHSTHFLDLQMRKQAFLAIITPSTANNLPLQMV